MQLKQPVSPVTTKFKVMTSAGKVMPTLKAYCFSIRTAMQDSIHKKGTLVIEKRTIALVWQYQISCTMCIRRQFRSWYGNFLITHHTVWGLPLEIFTTLVHWKNTS